jgi:hypothetical protein
MLLRRVAVGVPVGRNTAEPSGVEMGGSVEKEYAMFRRKLGALCVGATLVVSFAGQADALTITAADVGKTFSYTVVGESDSDVTADFQWLVTSYTTNGSTTVGLTGTIENTSSIDSELRGFGFDTTPALADGTSIGGSSIFDGLHIEDDPLNVATEQTVEFCAGTDEAQQNCTGFGDSGLDDGSTDTVFVTLVFSGAQQSIVLTNFYARWQAVDNQIGSDKGFTPDTPGGGFDPEIPVPEPGTLSLLGFGVAGMIARRARRAA